VTTRNRDYCYNCGVSFIGESIPLKDRKYYGPPYYYRREIGLYDRDKDRVIAYKCPDCGYQWDRED